MISFPVALALLFVGAVTRSTLAAAAQAQWRSLDAEYRRRALAVVPPVPDAEKDSAEAVEAIR